LNAVKAKDDAPKRSVGGPNYQLLSSYGSRLLNPLHSILQ